MPISRGGYESPRTQAHIKANVTGEYLSYLFLLPSYTHSVTRILPEPRLLQINVVNLTELTVNTQRPTARVTQVLSNPFQAQRTSTSFKWCIDPKAITSYLNL